MSTMDASNFFICLRRLIFNNMCSSFPPSARCTYARIIALNRAGAGQPMRRYSVNKQEAQLMPTNPRDAFRGQSRSTNIVPFHMLGIVSSCAITLSLRRTVFLLFDFKKYRDLEIRVRGHSSH